MSKHTPGPWRWSEGLLVSQKRPYNVVLREHSMFAPEPADSALVEAAPDLLEALETLLKECDQYHVSGALPSHDVARAVIARAKGEKKNKL